MRVVWVWALVLLLLGALAATSGCGGVGSTPSATPSASPQATLSQSDSAALAFMVATTTRIDAAAAAADDFRSTLETGKWATLSGPEQLAVLSDLESLSQKLTRTIVDGLPVAAAADVRAIEKGAFTQAADASSDYISEAAAAASNLAYLPAAKVNAVAPGWVKRIGQKASSFAPPRRRLEQGMAALQAKYGG
jgi:hypothetical protein